MTTVTFEKVDATEELRIIPDTLNGPMLEIAQKNVHGVVLFSLRYNLTAVDELIGKLIKMRDHMDQMKNAEPPYPPER
jgi:hypothetical protein